MVADVWMLQPWGGCTDCTQRFVGGLNLGRLKFLHGVQLRQAKSALSSHGCKTHLSTAVVVVLVTRITLLSFPLQSVGGYACWKWADLMIFWDGQVENRNLG